MQSFIDDELQNYILVLSKKHSIHLFIFFVLLIIQSYQYCYTQVSDKLKDKPRIVQVDNSMESVVTYSCRDSIVADMSINLITLYGEAKIVYDGIIMTADKIEFDTEKKEVYCIYTINSEGERVGIPKFEQGAESFTAASIRYNFDTSKGYIEELKTNQEELFFHMGKAKRQPNDQVHFLDGKITTCDLDEPHFHFGLSKGVMVPGERIATGPMNLWVKDIPTPIGLPFSSLPMKDQDEPETGGLLFPQFAPASPFGFGFQDLGYYFPIEKSDRIHTSIYGSLYSSGTFEIRNQTDYMDRYKYQGGVNLSYASFKRPFPADTTRDSKVVVQWSHRQQQKANPYWNFNSRVNFQSDNNGQTNLDPLSDQFFQNQFNSDINLTRNFPTLPITMGVKAALKQNSASGNFDVDLPTFTANVNRFFPLKILRKDNIGKEKFYEKIGMTYNMEARNRGFFADSLIEKEEWGLIQNSFLNGVRHNARLITAIPLFGQRVTLSPSIDYNLRMNFQQIQRNYNPAVGQTIDTLNQFGVSHDISGTLDLSTNLYAYYAFAWDKDLKMRHVITPTIAFQIAPNWSSFVTDNVGPQGQEISYSPYERSLYREPNGREVGLLRYNVNNTFELKRRARRDTLEEFERIKIIDAFTISGNYDFFKDTLQFSDVKLAMRLSPITGFSIVSGADFSPYGWDENTGQILNDLAYDLGQGPGRFRSFNFSTSYTFSSQESREKIEKNQEDFNTHWEADFRYFALNPHEIIDFDIPWKLSVQYNLFYNLNTNSDVWVQRKFRETQSLTFSGDVTLTKRWKLGFNANYDVTSSQMTQTRFSLNRDMHCWALGFFWTPVSGQQSFLVRFNAKSTLFEAAKVEIQKPPEFL